MMSIEEAMTIFKDLSKSEESIERKLESVRIVLCNKRRSEINKRSMYRALDYLINILEIESPEAEETI